MCATSQPKQGLRQRAAIAPRDACGFEAVSFLVSFVYVLRRSMRTTWNGQPRLQTLLICAGSSRADLESVLGR